MSNEATAKDLTLGLAGEYGVYNANVIYQGDEPIATVYGIPINTALEDVNPVRFAEGLKWGNKIVTAVNEHDALLAEIRAATDRFESEHELLTKVVAERNELREEVGRLREALVKAAIPYEALLADAESRKWIAPEVWAAIEAAVIESRAALSGKVGEGNG
jgi:hypothetical protein